MKYFFYVILILTTLACGSKSPEDVLMEVDAAAKISDVDAQIASYTYFYENFKEHEKFPVVLFQLGFMHHNDKKDLAKSKAYYEEFLKLFPKHEMAMSAQVELDNLGVPADQLKFLQNDSTETIKLIQ